MLIFKSSKTNTFEECRDMLRIVRVALGDSSAHLLEDKREKRDRGTKAPKEEDGDGRLKEKI